jgi:hypothetical protein
MYKELTNMVGKYLRKTIPLKEEYLYPAASKN